MLRIKVSVSTGVDGRGGREAGVRSQVQAVQVEREAVEGAGHRQDEGARRKDDGKNQTSHEEGTGSLLCISCHKFHKLESNFFLTIRRE